MFWVSEFSCVELYVSGCLIAPRYGLQADSAIEGRGEGSRERCWGQPLSVWLPTDGSQTTIAVQREEARPLLQLNPGC